MVSRLPKHNALLLGLMEQTIKEKKCLKRAFKGVIMKKKLEKHCFRANVPFKSIQKRSKMTSRRSNQINSEWEIFYRTDLVSYIYIYTHTLRNICRWIRCGICFKQIQEKVHSWRYRWNKTGPELIVIKAESSSFYSVLLLLCIPLKQKHMLFEEDFEFLRNWSRTV